jgi:hypothetical protein
MDTSNDSGELTMTTQSSLMQHHLRRVLQIGGMVVIIGTAACKDLTPPLPAGTQNPNSFKNPEGALALYRGALRIAKDGLANFLVLTGQFTDELQSNDVGNPALAGRVPEGANGRNIDGTFSLNQNYAALNGIRTNTMQAIAALSTYAPESSPVLRAEMYALQGYAAVMLAELYCSGIPLSTVDFEGDYTFKPGSTTIEVYTHAIALFDTAISLSQDSARVLNLARVGKARALLNLGRFAEAAEIANAVPTGYQYDLPMLGGNTTGSFLRSTFASVTVSDREGQNGLPFRSSRDPRSRVRSNGKLQYLNDSIWIPLKYDLPTGSLTVVVADAIEARLIEAEYDLWNDGIEWLTILNTLRTDGTYTTNGAGDTIWNAGSGGVSGLRPLTDPALEPLPPGKDAKPVREDLLFAERGYWLFLTGHRQGDFRRLIRHYGRDSETVYPTGYYDPSGFAQYGRDITAPVPDRERNLNPLYTGCFGREA